MLISKKYQAVLPHIGIRFNNKKVSYVQEADEEEGWIERFKKDHTGKIIVDDTNAPILFKDHGEVKIVIDATCPKDATKC